MGTCSIKVLLKVTIIGVAHQPRRWHNQFSNWTKGKTFWPSLPERCFYIGHSPRDNYTKFLFFLRHSPTILSSLGLFSNYMCFSQKDFPSSQKLPKEDQVGKTGNGATALPSPHIGRAGNECQRGSFFSHLSLCPATLHISYPILGPALSYLDQPLKVLQDSGRVDIDL